MLPPESKHDHFCPSGSALRAQSLPLIEQSEDWATALNDWKDAEIRDFEAQPGWSAEGEGRKRGGAGLIDYGVPGGADDIRSVASNGASGENR